MSKPLVDTDTNLHKEQLEKFQAIVNPKPSQEEQEQLVKKIQHREGGRNWTPPSKNKKCCQGEKHGENQSCHCQTK